MPRFAKSLLLSLIFIFCYSSSSIQGHAATVFTDVNDDHWAKDEIEFLQTRNIINGYPDGSKAYFKPEANVTRAQAAKMLSIARGKTELHVSNASFPDVPTDHYASGWIERAIHEGYFDRPKSTKDTFNPNGLLTRDQMSKVVAIAFNLNLEASSDKPMPFSDIPKDYWAYQHISSLYYSGITTGSNNRFLPRNNITRAQFSAFLARALSDSFKVKPAPVPVPEPKPEPGPVGDVYHTTIYPISLNEIINIQMTKSPQTDLYRNGKSFVHKNFVKLAGTTFPTTGIVTTNGLNVREGAGETYWIIGKLNTNARVSVIGRTGDWLEIKYGTWRNAKMDDLTRFINPTNFAKNSSEYFQFLLLSKSAGISLEDLNNKILVNKGILSGKGQAFIDASRKYKINEIYLISHSLLETGNGNSSLSKGMLVSSIDGKSVEPKIVYNMYGIGAYDRCPEQCGSETAYKNGWFTPEAAIIGGAQYIANSYINHDTYKQNTLYKMRWNPENPGTHQYATDIGWAVKQVNNIKKLYDLIDRYTQYYDVPSYK
ncbi:beta-N-acetylglucosaminidase [Oikeobacillus pervagus]|uniref:Beta-N-acetylglucosaminidase n=1 Tax=Oikeobacillus pervagus TaxID=1325931 RepID=A0AAJ1T4Z6_9BACI|nr:S-layer homology domain-containing protein [Oikeobacillus pervagus]MDQ0215301.1 beta-N-acetylglucosaminidase [Oikeobacillus pervagus]